MSWAPVAVMGVLIALSLALVRLGGKDPIFIAVALGLGSIAAVLLVAAVFSMFLPPDHRRAFWKTILMTARDDLRDIRDALTFKKEL